MKKGLQKEEPKKFTVEKKKVGLKEGIAFRIFGVYSDNGHTEFLHPKLAWSLGRQLMYHAGKLLKGKENEPENSKKDS